MSTQHKADTPAEQYDRMLRTGHYRRLPADYPRPRPTAEWPPENVALLEHYYHWLLDGGSSPAVIRTIYLPMAGHVLGFNLKHHAQLNLDTDLQCAMDFLKAKQLGAGWIDSCRNSLLRFRRFLLHQRGLVEVKITAYEPKRHAEELPAWLVCELEHYQHIKQRNWRVARVDDRIRNFWGNHLRIWLFLCKQCGVADLADVKRKHLLDFIDHRLSAGYAVSGVNADLHNFHAFLLFLQEQEYVVPRALLRLPTLKEPERLPKFLTDEQVRLLRDDFEARVEQARDTRQRRDAVLDRAVFHLLWQSGMRVGEIEELRLEDLDLAGRKLTVREGKGLKDRTVFLTDTTVRVLRAYLEMRGMGPTDHMFLYRNQSLCKELVHARIQSAGKRVGVKAYPHRLRHTCATQLLNAGCRVTSIQKLLGHKELGTTMIYARVHDQTVADDYYTAMQHVEQRLDLLGQPETTPEPPQEPPGENLCIHLLALTEQLASPDLNAETRLEIVMHMRSILVEECCDP